MIPEDLKKELNDIADILATIATSSDLFSELVLNLEVKEYSDAQIQALQEYATPTLFQNVDRGSLMWLHYSGQKMYKSLKTRNSHNVIKEIQAISRGIQGILS